MLSPSRQQEMQIGGFEHKSQTGQSSFSKKTKEAPFTISTFIAKITPCRLWL